MTPPRDYYEALGVPRDADARTIKDAFRQLARRYHPDISSEEDAEQRFREIAEAYGVLSDPAKRARYDAAGSARQAGATPEDLWAGIGPLGGRGRSGARRDRPDIRHPRRPGVVADHHRGGDSGAVGFAGWCLLPVTC